MPSKIVLHAGFHKTGTSSAQQVLRQNRPVLRPYLKSLLKWGMRDLLHASRGYSTWRDPLSLAKFSRRFRRLLKEQPKMPDRALVLSAEELSGHMPGRGDLADYSAAPILAERMARDAASIWPEAEICFVYSTRAPQDWLTSAYWEHVKSSSMTLDQAAFLDRYRAAGDLSELVADIRDRTGCTVTEAPLEVSRDAVAGPATPVLEAAGVPVSALRGLAMPGRANARLPQEVLLALLDANRAYSDRSARKAAKTAIIARATQQDQGDPDD